MTTCRRSNASACSPISRSNRKRRRIRRPLRWPRPPPSRSRAFRIVFLGTSSVAVAALEALLAGGREIAAVYTRPDRRSGRGRQPHTSPIKEAALTRGLVVEQPENWDQAACDAFADRRPDLAIVVSYGTILPEVMLDIPRLGCVNLHTSLLPRWRGAAPMARAIEAGDELTGVSLIKLTPAPDTGPVIAQQPCPIKAHDTAATLGGKLAQLGAQMLNPFLEDAERLLDAAAPQSEDGACYAHKLSKDEATIDWSRSAAEIERKVRALIPWPVAQTQLGTMTLRVWESEVCTVSTREAGEPGRIATDGKRLTVHCGQDALTIKKLQPPGKKIMSVQDFLNGHTVAGHSKMTQ